MTHRFKRRILPWMPVDILPLHCCSSQFAATNITLMYTSPVRNVSGLIIILRKPGGFQWSTLAWIFSRLSIASVDGKQHLSEIVFSALVGFPLFDKYPTFWGGGRHTWNAGNLITLKVWFFSKESLNQVQGMCWSSRDGGADCLMTTTPISCAAQHHIGEGRHPSTTHWWLFDPVVCTRGVQWKSDESTKHYLTQILLAINWRYSQARKKILVFIWRFKVASCISETHQVFSKKKLDTFPTDYLFFWSEKISWLYL